MYIYLIISLSLCNFCVWKEMRQLKGKEVIKG